MALRILIVSDNYPPFIGGAHRQTQLLARELNRRGHAVAVATLWHGGLPLVADEAGIEVHRLRQTRSWLPGAARAGRQQRHPPFPDPVTVAGLRRVLAGFRPDVVHTYGWISYSCAAALLGWDTPLLISARDYALGCATRELLYAGGPCAGPSPAKCLGCAAGRFGPAKGALAAAGVALGRPLLARKVRGVHSVSTYVEQMVERDFLKPAGLAVPRAVIPSFREDGADEEPAHTPGLAGTLAQLPAEPFILFVGALRVVKGLEHLLIAYQRLENPPPLVLIGTVEADTPRDMPPGVHVLQDVPHPAVLAAWDRCLFGVLPSLWPEPLGSVVYEGMSRGKAVIGTKPGGHTDLIVDGVTGLLIRQGDTDALANTMRALIVNAGLRERLGQAGRQRARQFTARVAVPRFEKLYGDLAARELEGVHERHALPLGRR